MTAAKTDEEVICEWMEPKPDDKKGGSVADWWERTVDGPRWTWKSVTLTLDRLREVEARLSDVQWGHYEAEMARVCWPGMHVKLRPFVHATAAQKIAALAAVIRAEAK